MRHRLLDSLLLLSQIPVAMAACGGVGPSVQPVPTPLARDATPAAGATPALAAPESGQPSALSPAETLVATPGPACTVASDALNLREGPDAGFVIVGRLTSGAAFIAIDRNPSSSWLRGDGGGRRGWVARRFLDCNFDPSDLPTADPLPPTYTPAPTTVPTPAPSSPLAANDAPPSGVLAQLSTSVVYLLDFGWCLPPEGGASAPMIGVPAGGLEIGVVRPLCAMGFTPETDVAFAITQPDGVERRGVVRTDDEGIAKWQWRSLPGDPRGSHHVMATAGDQRAKAVFDVDDPSRPMAFVQPDSGTPGTLFHVSAAGFEPGQAVDLYLYRRTEGGCDGAANCFAFATIVHLGPADHRGDAFGAIRSVAEDRTERFGLAAAPPLRLNDLAMFEVDSR